MSQALRYSLIFLIFASIILLSLYALREGPKKELLYKEAILNLKRYQGQTLSFSYAYIKDIQKNLIFIEQFNTYVPVKIQDSLLKKGEFISLKGVLNSQGLIEAQEWYLHKNRRLKYWVSLLPLLLISYYSIKNFNDKRN